MNIQPHKDGIKVNLTVEEVREAFLQMNEKMEKGFVCLYCLKFVKPDKNAIGGMVLRHNPVKKIEVFFVCNDCGFKKSMITIRKGNEILTIEGNDIESD